MQVYTFEIRDRNLALVSDDNTLVRTSVNADVLELYFYDEEWLGHDLMCAFAVDGNVFEKHLSFLETPQEPAEGELAPTWVARSYVVVPDEVLEHTGALGVTVHSVGSDEHIITALSTPLEIRQEGDGIGDAPSANPGGGQ